MTHALTTNPREGHLNTTTVTDDALVFDALVFSAGALPVAGRSEDPLAEESPFFRLECPVVDSFRIENLAMGPRTDGLGIGNGNGDLVEGIRLGIHSVKFAKIGFNTHEISLSSLGFMFSRLDLDSEIIEREVLVVTAAWLGSGSSGTNIQTE